MTIKEAEKEIEDGHVGVERDLKQTAFNIFLRDLVEYTDYKPNGRGEEEEKWSTCVRGWTKMFSSMTPSDEHLHCTKRSAVQVSDV